MTSAKITEMRNNPAYKNFYAVGNAFNYLCEGLRPYVERKMKDFHVLMLSKTSGAVCTCPFVPNKPNPHTYVKKSCIWAKQLGKFHCNKKKSRILWHQSDSTKWHDPVLGYWEVAKLFMSDLGNDKGNVKDPNSTDSTGLLNLLYFCSYFNVQQDSIRSVRDWRNKLAHSPNQSLTDSQKNSAINDILKLLDDPELMACKEVQDQRKTIEDLRSADFSILHEEELQIWKEINRCQLNNEEKKKRKQMEKNLKAQRKNWADTCTRTSKNLPGIPPENKPPTESIFHLFAVVFISLIYRQCCSCRNMIWKYFCCFLLMSILRGVGDKAMLHLDKGCFRATVKSPISHFGFQEFNFSYHLNAKRNNFFGREWLFQELENIFQTDQEVQGVLITGEPGSGKSAIMSQLICSPDSSLLIHNNIIGYHMCVYSEKGTRNGPRFVRNLVDQITGSIPEYSEYVAENKQIRKLLDERCDRDAVGCFYGTIVGPLREIKNKQKSLRYIMIDALDECIEKDGKTSAILEILRKKLLDFPNWLKIILSSRNGTTIIKTLPQTIKRVTLDPTDKRNLQDIHSYISWFQHSPSFMDKLWDTMWLTSTTGRINSLISELSKKGVGNFLFVTATLQYFNSSGRINFQTFPTRLYHIYSIHFERLFDEENFSPFRTLFEILLVSNTPLRPSDIDMIFKLQNLTYKASELVQKISYFLQFGENGTVWIYHQSFAEWLMNQTDHTHWLFIAKSRGHKYIADYLFEVIKQKLYIPSLNELSELATHLLAGENTEDSKERLKLMNVSKIRDPDTKKCILHVFVLMPHPTSTALLDMFLELFPSADIPDRSGWTPAFFAAIAGNIENLKIFINKGKININYVIKHKATESKIAVLDIFQKINLFEDFSMVHIAAFFGRTKVIDFLIKSGASFREFGGNRVTPLQVAAQTNDLEVVQLLCQYSVQADVIALHHAAAKNHTDILQHLLKHTNVRDKCLPCKPGNISDFDQNTTLLDIHIFFCETALHAAVSRGHLEIVKLLLSFGNASLECKHHSGKTPLMEAVERNDKKMVALLLEAGADVEATCDHIIAQQSRTTFICLFPSLFEDLYTLNCGKDVCSFSYRAIHLCAKYGLWKIAEELILKWNATILAFTSDNQNPISIAINYDHIDFINNFNRTLGKKTGDVINNEYVLEIAVMCGSSKTVRWLFSHTTDRNMFGKLYANDMTLLHIAASWSPYPNSTDTKVTFCYQGQEDMDCILHRNCSAEMVELKMTYKKRLKVVKLLVKSQKEHASSFVNKKDGDGKTPLHYAAVAGFVGAVRFLVEQGSDWKSKDRNGYTPLHRALLNSSLPRAPLLYGHCHKTKDNVFSTCNTTLFDETVNYFIWLNRSNIRKCDAYTVFLLNTVVLKMMPISLYTLLQIGADANCSVSGIHTRLFLLPLNMGASQVSEVFKIFKVNITLECNVPFEQSELHLISHAYVPGDIGNFFKSSVNNHPSPMQRLVSYHEKGFRIFDECRDKEGYLPIHRAAQGGNSDAIEWFISLRVNASLKTQSGLTALDFSIMFLTDITGLSSVVTVERLVNFINRNHFLNTENTKKQRFYTFKKILEGTLKGIGYEWYSTWCNPKLKTLSPLHVASFQGIGMFEFVYKKVVEIAPDSRVPLNCTNKHGVSPLYLSYIFENSKTPCNYANLSCIKTTNLNIDQTYLKYPVREAEYHIIYYSLHKTPSKLNITIDLHDIMDCPGYYDLLPKKKTLHSEMNKCNYDCWEFIEDVHEDILDTFPYFKFKEYNETELGTALVYKLKMLELQYFLEKRRVSGYLAQRVARGLKCASECHCTNVMRELQILFALGKRRKDRQVNKFTAKRMGWADMSPDGDVQDRWPFYFLFKKAMNQYKSFDYLKDIFEGGDNAYCHYDNNEDKEEASSL